MSVFLRWGIFGILAVAGLIYAYNASKKLAEIRSKERPAAVQSRGASESDTETATDDDESTGAEDAPVAGISVHCAAELEVARRALQARRDGEPLDRLLRIPEIAWQEPPARRERLAKVATDWFNLEGEVPIPAEFRNSVISDCERVSPAP
jgi:hypothetical protein